MRPAALVGLVFLSLANGCGGSGEGRGEERTPSSRAPAVASPTPSPAAVPPGPDPIGDGLRAAPSWALRLEPRVPGYRAGASNVPQLAEAALVYESLPEAPSVFGGGLLLCRVLISHAREWDSSGMFGRNVAPDVNVHVRTGAGREARIPLAEDAYEGVFALPLPADPPSRELAIRLVDRDLAADDRIATFAIEAPYRLPIVESEPNATVRCRALPTTEVEARARPVLETVLARLARLGSPPAAPSLEREPAATDERLAPIRASVREAASLLGFAHPEVRSLVERVDGYESSVYQRAARSFDAEHERAAGAGAPLVRGTMAKAVGLDCARPTGADEVRCRLRVEAEYSRIPDPPGFAAPIAATLVPRGLRPAVCSPEAVPGEETGFVRTTGRVIHVFTCDFEARSEVPAGPFLARLSQGGARAFVRVEGGGASAP